MCSHEFPNMVDHRMNVRSYLLRVINLQVFKAPFTRKLLIVFNASESYIFWLFDKSKLISKKLFQRRCLQEVMPRSTIGDKSRMFISGKSFTLSGPVSVRHYPRIPQILLRRR